MKNNQYFRAKRYPSPGQREAVWPRMTIYRLSLSDMIRVYGWYTVRSFSCSYFTWPISSCEDDHGSKGRNIHRWLNLNECNWSTRKKEFILDTQWFYSYDVSTESKLIRLPQWFEHGKCVWWEQIGRMYSLSLYSSWSRENWRLPSALLERIREDVSFSSLPCCSSSVYPCNKGFCWKNFQWRGSASDATTFSLTSR